MSSALRFSPRVFDLGPARDLPLERVTWALREHAGCCALDSAGGAPRTVSIVGFDPLALQGSAAGPVQLQYLRANLARLEARPGDPVPGPFQGGFLGALSYELGVDGEDRSRTLAGGAGPRVLGGLYVDFLVLDHGLDRAWLVLGDEPGDQRADVSARRRRLVGELARSGEPPEPSSDAALVRHVSSREHRRRIEEVRRRIAAGDLYQANLAHRFTCATRAHPMALYAALRRANPSPYAALVFDAERGDHAVLSSSPELLLEYDGSTRHARTRPIKGTIQRGDDPQSDARRAAQLLASEKDRAELAMIVDLERNDLGRVCELGSVRVGEFPALETYPNLHHLCADVTGTLRAELDAVDALAALFPGGSVTGAPKLASMEAIAELEGEGRGFFTGSAGFLSLDGSACFNILIRTLEWSRRGGRAGGRASGEVTFWVGGGITWSSDAESEDRETLLKGRALARALGASLAPGDALESALPSGAGSR